MADFTEALRAIFNGTHKPAPKQKRPASPAAGQPIGDHPPGHFVEYARTQIMPLLNKAVEVAEAHGAKASAGMSESEGRVTAELTIIPSNLPQGARPPRLAVYAPGQERPLEVEFTGTFPHEGRDGGYGAEVDYDAIHPEQLEEKVLDFIALATGA